MGIVKISDLPLVDSPVEGTDLFVVVQDNVTKKAYASDIQTYVGFEEIQYATAGQTVFNLTTMTYAAGANNLQVFVDGVNQYEGLSYTETDNNTVTFSQGLHQGAVVKFSTVQTQTSSVASAGAVTFLQAGTGAVARSVQSKERDTVSVKDFGAQGDGVTDDTAAFQAAVNNGGRIFIPPGNYIFNQPVIITNIVTLVGAGRTTVLRRNYSPTVDTDGIFNIRDGGSDVSMRDMTLISLSGQTGGCLLSIVNTNAQAIGQMTFINMGFTTTGSSTHQYTIYMDGTAKTTAPIGIRGIDMIGCSVFGGGISTLLVKGVLKFSFLGGGCFTAGGAAGSNVRFDGVSGVETQSFQFLPSDCSCPISFDRAKLGIFACGIMGEVTNTSNTQNIIGYGFTGSLQENWQNSMFINTSTGLKLTQDNGITNDGSSNPGGLTMRGTVTGYARTVSGGTQIGHAGVGYTTNTTNGQAFSFQTQSGKMFWIATGGGAAALVFADYKSATITLVSNPSGEFEASSTPAGGKTGLYKNTNSHTINVLNNTGGAANYSICSLGPSLNLVNPS
jgi:hypothetical protein